MLIQFSVTNFRSIKATQTFSMVAAIGGELLHNTFSTGNKLRLLTSVAIFGGNASGKSNLLSAMNFVENFVVSSSKDRQKGEAIDVTPFKLSSTTENAPSEFEFIFIVNDKRYQYGFSVTRKQVMEEYLFVFENAKPQKWFHRVWDKDNACYIWSPFSSYLKGSLKEIKEATRDNALFVSTAVQMNHKQLSPLVDWFQKKLAVVPLYQLHHGYTVNKIRESEAAKKNILHFLRTADLDIQDLEIESKPLREELASEDMPASVRAAILEQLTEDDAQVHKILSLHKHNDTDRLIPFDFNKEESRGTKAMLAATGPILDVLENGRTLAVDELDSSLHPHLVRFIVELFHNPKTNPKHAQLIFVVHDTSLLDNQLLRRDQIWLVEKNKEHATELHPLSDYSPRKQESLQKGYLHGRYGGLPNVGHFELLGVELVSQ